MNAIERELTDGIRWSVNDVHHWETRSDNDTRRCTRNLLRTLTACLEYWALVHQVEDAKP